MPEAKPIPEALLEMVEADGTRRNVPLDQSPFLIGRGPEEGNQLQLSDKRISRRSAALVYEDGAFRVEDRGQRQGIFVNGEKVENAVLSEGDVITLGAADSFQVIFHMGAQTQEAIPQLLSRFEGAAALEAGTRDIRQLSLLLEATALLQSRLPVEEVLGAMVDRAIEITDADRGLLLEAGAEGGLRPLLARQQGRTRLSPQSISPSQTAINHALERQRGVVEEDLSQAAEALRGAASVVLQRLRTVVAIPLFSLMGLRATEASSISTRGQLVGVLYLDSRRTAAFSHLQRQILDALALEAASVLDNARLVQKERERRRMEQELAIARDIQQALLPKHFGSFPHLEVTGINRSCFAVGGDYFDLMDLGPDRTAFVIADVCGKGLAAALLTAILQGTFSAMAMGQAPAPVFAYINRFICHHEMQRYATLFYGMVDTAGRVEYINAGHLPPLLIRNGRVETAFGDGCLPIGLLEQAEFKTETAQLNPGDTLVLVTDGITEAMDPEEEQFGTERLQEVVQRYADAPVEQLQAAILKAVEEFSRGAYQADDITLLILRYRRCPVSP